MNVTVKLFATLRIGRFDEKVMNVDSGTDIDYLIKTITLKREDVAIIFINGRHGEYDTKISDGDVIALFPPIGGG